MLVIKIGGPAYRIGMGGGAASSVPSGGSSRAELDFNAVQVSSSRTCTYAMQSQWNAWILAGDVCNFCVIFAWQTDLYMLSFNAV